jgi:hypothetical protein
MPHPEGVSGGPVWWFEKTPRSQFWSPTAGRIIGVVAAYDEAKTSLRAVDCARWREWFEARCRDIAEM